MKFRLLVLFFLLGVLGCLSVTAAPQAGRKQRSKTDFKTLMIEEAKAIDTLNMSNVAPFHAKEPENVFYDIAPLKYTGWSEFAEGAQKLLSTWASMKCTISDDARTH